MGLEAARSAELVEHYVRVRPGDIAYLKYIFESYEIVGFLRTIDPKAAVVVVLAVPDFRREAEAILESVAREIPIERIPKPRDLGDDWLVTRVIETDGEGPPSG